MESQLQMGEEVNDFETAVIHPYYKRHDDVEGGNNCPKLPVRLLPMAVFTL